jgi:hypothetical protein
MTDPDLTPPAYIEALAIRLMLALYASNWHAYRATLIKAMLCRCESKVIGTLVTTLVGVLNEHEPDWSKEAEDRLKELLDTLDGSPA